MISALATSNRLILLNSTCAGPPFIYNWHVTTGDVLLSTTDNSNTRCVCQNWQLVIQNKTCLNSQVIVIILPLFLVKEEMNYLWYHTLASEENLCYGKAHRKYYKSILCLKKQLAILLDLIVQLNCNLEDLPPPLPPPPSSNKQAPPLFFKELCLSFH